jgi:hypothetical protein
LYADNIFLFLYKNIFLNLWRLKWKYSFLSVII